VVTLFFKISRHLSGLELYFLRKDKKCFLLLRTKKKKKAITLVLVFQYNLTNVRREDKNVINIFFANKLYFYRDEDEEEGVLKILV